MVVFNIDMFYQCVVEHYIDADETITKTLKESRKYYLGWRFAIDFLSNSHFYFEAIFKSKFNEFGEIFIEII